MNISDFRSVIHKFDGPARPNLFYVEIFGINSQYIKNWELRAFCKTATFPGINFQTFEYRPNGYGLPTQMPSGINSEPLNCIFMLDSKHAVLSFFHEWMQKILNYSTANGSFSSINNQLPYEIGFKKEYSATIKITYFSSDNIDSNYSVTLEGAYPTNIGSLTLSWDDNDTISLLPVNFSYEKIQFDSERFGTYRPRFFKDLDIEDITGLLGGYNNSESGGNSISDIINNLYEVKTDSDLLTDATRSLY